jgi:hypothetical protein
MLSEIRQSQKDKFHMFSLISGSYMQTKQNKVMKVKGNYKWGGRAGEEGNKEEE